VASYRPWEVFMRDPNDLVTEHSFVNFSTPPILVYAFSGFVDAGSGVRLFAEHILQHCEHSLLATFDIDELLDYRARRPRMQFIVDHFASVDMPRIELHQVIDSRGKQFLLLVGPEPDYQWNRFLAAIESIVIQYQVQYAVGVSAIPWPMPHTRPIGLTVHGNNRDSLFGAGSVIGEIEVPGHVGALLELRLGEMGLDSIGITAQIPHYLAQFEFPQGAIALIDGLVAGPDLVIPRTDLDAQAAKTLESVAEQIDGNEEFAAVVSALEAQYDQIAAALTAGAGGLADADIPSADQIAAQVEAFLAEVESNQEPGKDTDS
jgi:hypothetical protein